MHMCPTKKKPYYTVEQAEMVHQFMFNKKGADPVELRKLEVYWCDECGYYHLGKLEY